MTDSEKLDLILDKLVKLDTLEERIDALEKRIYSLEKRIYSLETDIKDIKFTIENEIRANLQAVAEGHLDLSRNLHDAIKPGNEIEMLIVKVRMLETDVRRLKEKIS